MAKEDLCPLGQEGNEEYDAEVRSHLKGSGSNKRKIAQNIRRLKEGSYKNLDNSVVNIIKNPELSAKQIYQLIKAVLDNKDISISQQINLIKAMSDSHRTLFGSKMEIKDNSNLLNKQLQRIENYEKENEK